MSTTFWIDLLAGYSISITAWALYRIDKLRIELADKDAEMATAASLAASTISAALKQAEASQAVDARTIIALREEVDQLKGISARAVSRSPAVRSKRNV